MATFQFEAKNAQGASTAGLIDAADLRGAAAALRDQGLFPTKLEVARGSGWSSSTNSPTQFTAAEMSPLEDVLRAPLPIRDSDSGRDGSTPPPITQPSGYGDLPPGFDLGNRNGGTGAGTASDASRRPYASVAPTKSAAPFLVSVPLTDLAVMYRQMATLQESGVPIVQSLQALTAQTTHPRLKEILQEATKAVASGYPLSAVMEQHPAVFTGIQIELIRAGEASGLTAEMCGRIAGYLEREIDIRRKINRETLYPKIVLFVAGLVILLLTGLKAGMGSVWEKVRFAALVGAVGFGTFWFYRYAKQYPSVARIADRLRLMVPGAGGVEQRYATARFARALASLYGGGVLLPRAVEISARACGNEAITQRVLGASSALYQGQGIAGVLEKSGLLSPLAVQMARTGEQTGNIDQMMEKVADHLEQEADVKAHQQAVFVGVGALMLAAVVVLYIAITFYMGQFAAATQISE